MKKCEDILELLSLYIDNELDDETSKLVKEHVELCSSCKDELVQLQQVVKMCNEVDEVELPDSFNEVLHQKLKLEHKKMEDDKKITVMRNRILKTITSVAAIFIVIFAVRGFMNIGMLNKGDSSNKNAESMNNIMSFDSVMNERERGTDWSAQSANEILADGDVSDKDKETGDVAFTAKADGTNYEDKGEVEVGINPTEAIAAKATTNDPKVSLQFNEPIESTYSMASVPAGGAVELIITLTATTENIESDKLKISELADKFGTKTEVSELNSLDEATEMHSFGGEISKYSISHDDSFSISYSMDKASYDKFIKEIEGNYSGEYSVTNDEEHLSGRLKEIDKRIKELEKNKSVYTDEYKSLNYDKEGIMKQLDNLNLSNNIRVDIKIYSD